MGTKYGWGIHIWDNKPEWSEPSRFISWISQLLFVVSIGLTKISILCSFLRISTSKRFNWLVWGTMGFIVIWMLVYILTTVFRCT